MREALIMFVLLMVNVFQNQPAAAPVATLAISVLVEWAWWTGRRLADAPRLPFSKVE